MSRTLLIGLVIAAAFIGFFYWSQVARASIGNLNIYEGTVDVARGNETIVGKTGSVIRKTDVIRVGSGSRVSIILKDGSVIRLEAESEVEIIGITYNDNEIDDASFRLIKGEMWSKVKPLSEDASWQVETPTAVASVRGTEFNTRYINKSSEFSIYGGKVGVALLTKRDAEKLLLPGNKFVLRDAALDIDFAKDPTVINQNQENEWARFNLGEDAKLENISSVSENADNISTTTEKMEEKPTPKPIVETKAEKKLSSLLLFGNKSILLVDKETQLKVQAKYSDGTIEETSFEKITWIKSAQLGSITTPGYFSSSKTGSVTISAKIGDITSNEVTIEVKNSLKVLKRIDISYVQNSLSEQIGNYNEPRHPTFQFTAVAVYEDGPNENVTSLSNWSVSGSASGSINSNGLYTPETKGDAMVKATYGGKEAVATISIP